MRMIFAWILFLGMTGVSQGQGLAKPHAGVDQAKVDAAIDKGVRVLLDYPAHNQRHLELVLYTLLHSGTPAGNPMFKDLLDRILEAPLSKTYNVALQAMFLQEFNPVEYQWRIAQCAQFLVDNQLKNGQWDYGVPVHIPVAMNRPKKRTRKVSTRVTPPHIKIRQMTQRKGTGDNSNSQYAILGLRACLQARVYPPVKTFDLARRWWCRSQNQDGGWEYRGATGQSYGSMTAGALGCLVILDHYLKKNWKRDVRVKRSVAWMARNFSVKKNPSRPLNRAHFYYLYALERAGIITGISKFGRHDWYREGANYLLKVQDPSGYWGDIRKSVPQTCFAILFLKRGTPSLPGVATGQHR